MGYEINVAKDGIHYFATAERSIGHDVPKLLDILEKLKIILPESEGYVYSVTNWDRVGRIVDVDRLIQTNVLLGKWRNDLVGGRGLESHE